MTTVNDMTLQSPPRITKPNYKMSHPTRWEKEKAAAEDPHAFEYPEDPKVIGPWIIGETVGKGASGRVKIARHKLTGKLAAVKILSAGLVARSRNSLVKAEKQRMGIEREIVMMKLMEHPNIMRLYDVWEGEKELFLILEWIEGGELFDLIVNRGRLPPLEALAYFKQIIHGLSYCHTFSIAHRDLKPENILIHGSSNELIKIADWGMAAFQSPSAQLETSCGSPHYASPEIIRGERYEGTKADIWSVGVVLFALVAGRLPFDDKNVPHLLSKVKSGKFEIPAYVYPEAADLIKKMLVVDVQKRITISEILVHPFFCRDTPGIYYIPPPSMSALHTPLVSVDDIDQDLLSSLRIIFGKHASRAVISQELLHDGPNPAKAFYVLLLKFRDRQMENFNGDRDDADTRTGPHPYQSPRVQPNELLSVAGAVSVPSNAPVHCMARPTHTRTQSSPTKHRSAPVSMRPRLPTISGARPARLPLPLSPVPNYATATTSSKSRDPAPIPMLSPAPVSPIPATPAPPYQAAAPARRPSSRRRDTTPATTGLGLGITAPITEPTSSVPVRANARRRDTSPGGPVPVLEIGSTTPPLVHSPRAPSPDIVGTKGMTLVPPRRVRRATSPAPPLFIKSGPTTTMLPPTSPVVPQTPVAAYVPVTMPPMMDPGRQQAIDVMLKQINKLGAQDNAQRLAEQSMIQPEHQKPKGPHIYEHSNQLREQAGFLPVAENEHSHSSGRSPQRSRAGSEGARRFPGAVKTSVYGHSNQSRERTGYLPSTQEEKENESIGVKNVKRGRAGSEGTRSTQGPFKKGMIRKSRPMALDLDGPSPVFSPRPTFNVTSPTSTPATPLLSPVVGEFRGWFSNLFNWKTPTYILHSHNNCLTTRDETAKLLEEFGVSVLLEDVQGWGVLKCKVDEVMDANSVVTQKQVRFRVEFQPYRALPPSSPALEGAVLPLPQIGVFGCTLTLIQEKGALSTFRAVYQRLRQGWRLDALQSPAVGSMGRPVATMEGGFGSGVMLVQ